MIKLLFMAILLIITFAANGNSLDATYTVPPATQQPKNVTYMYSRPETVKIDGKRYTRTVYHATNGRDYVQ